MSFDFYHHPRILQTSEGPYYRYGHWASFFRRPKLFHAFTSQPLSSFENVFPSVTLFLFSIEYFCSFLNLFFFLISPVLKLIYFLFELPLLFAGIAFIQELSFFVPISLIFNLKNVWVFFRILSFLFQCLFFFWVLNPAFYFVFLSDIYPFQVRFLFPFIFTFLSLIKVVISDFQLLFIAGLNHSFIFFVYLHFAILF